MSSRQHQRSRDSSGVGKGGMWGRDGRMKGEGEGCSRGEEEDEKEVTICIIQTK